VSAKVLDVRCGKYHAFMTIVSYIEPCLSVETLLEPDTKPVKLLVTRYPAPDTSRRDPFIRAVPATGEPICHNTRLVVPSSTSTPFSHTPSPPAHTSLSPSGGRPFSPRPRRTLYPPPPSKHKRGLSWIRSPIVPKTTILLRHTRILCLTAS
jgi:hypothetical protein